MQAKILERIIAMLISMLSADLLLRFADVVLDFIEKQVKGSASTVDDRIVLPLCELIRKTFNIPDEVDCK